MLFTTSSLCKLCIQRCELLCKRTREEEEVEGGGGSFAPRLVTSDISTDTSRVNEKETTEEQVCGVAAEIVIRDDALTHLHTHTR
jgi:hypothetical protein